MSLDLCIDPLGCEFPGLVNEILSLPTDNNDRSMVLACSITPEGFAYFLCNKVLYVWSYITKEKGINPHAYRLNLPTTGLNYSINSIVVANKDHTGLPSALAISPEGLLRYWPSISSSVPKDKELSLNNEVVLSVIPYSDEDHVTRYILATTTGSFYNIDIFKEHFSQGSAADGAITYRSIGINSSSLTRRMTSVIFGGGQKKQALIKTLVVKNFFASNEADLVAIYQTSIEICSAKKANVVKTIDARDYILRSYLKTAKETDVDPKRLPNIYIADVIHYNNGLLLLIAVSKHRVPTLSFALVHLTEQSVNDNAANFVTLVGLPPQHRLPVPHSDQPLPKINLYTPTSTNFIIVFPTMVVSLENVDADAESLCDITKFKEPLLGSACVNQFCQVILRKNGICDVRHLPAGFEINFWQKYKEQIESIDTDTNSHFEMVRKVFMLFASKNLPEARSKFLQMIKTFGDYSELAEFIVLMTKGLLDRIPPNDSRWKESSNQRTRSTTVRSVSITSQLEDKAAHYKMITMFLRYFGLFDKLNHPSKTFNGRSALTVLSEYGEKLYAMTITIAMISQFTLPSIETAIKRLAIEIQTSLRMMDNTILTPHDYFAKEVTSFDALIPAVMRVQQEEIKGKSRQEQLSLFTEVLSLYNTVIEGTHFYKSQDWTIAVNRDEQIWTNSQQILTHFNRQFNLIFDFVESERGNYENILKKLLPISRFILSQQSLYQRNRSSIIQRFYRFGKVDIALKLAEEYFDFATLIQHCYEKLPDVERQYQLEKYKTQFKNENFDIFLFEYYREHGLINDLLEQQGDRVEDFLSKHDEINWIRNIERREYDKAKETLQSIAYSAPNASRKKTLLSLAKLAALCEDQQNPEEIAQITNNLILLKHQENISPDIAMMLNPTNIPLSLEEIVAADIAENTAEGFLKALIALTSIMDTRELKTDIGMEMVEKLRNRIWISVVKAADWQTIAKEVSKLSNEEAYERFTKFLLTTLLADVMQRFIDYSIPPDCKLELLPKSTEPLKDVFPLKNNEHARHLFNEFLDTNMEHVVRSIEKEAVQESQ
uniref:Nucleoporin Nup133/Nup155-like C-terminal domain-containing protein n=1 Tax=Panagrolaimus sp. PS1159 TaxID=55785 RepID=A0AC35F1W0_9BILA